VDTVNIDDHNASTSATGQDLLVSYYSQAGAAFHPIVAPLALHGLVIKLFSPKAVFPLKLERRGADAPKVDMVAFSSKDTMVNKTVKGPLPLIVTVEQGSIKGVTLDRGNTRIVVIGDSLCFDNANLEAAANHYFANLTVNWLLDRPQILLAGLGPRPLKEYKLMVAAAQFREVCWILLAALPGVVLLIGGVVRLGRRR
jgi:hypothetical protein